MNNPNKLRQLMDEHGKTTADIAELMGVQPQRVREWLSSRPISAWKLELLTFKLKANT